MNVLAPTLFDAPPTTGTARKGDRYSSQEAARRTNVKQSAQRVLDALTALGGTGDLDGLCERLPADLRNSISRRLTDLCEAGLVRATGEYREGRYGRPLAVWEVTGR